MIPQAEYDILDIDCPAVFFGCLDLGGLRHGDQIEIKVFLGAGGKEKLNFQNVFAGPLGEPIIDLPERYGSSVKVTIKQIAGRSAKIEYDFRWRSIE